MSDGRIITQKRHNYTPEQIRNLSSGPLYPVVGLRASLRESPLNPQVIIMLTKTLIVTRIVAGKIVIALIPIHNENKSNNTNDGNKNNNSNTI